MCIDNYDIRNGMSDCCYDEAALTFALRRLVIDLLNRYMIAHFDILILLHTYMLRIKSLYAKTLRQKHIISAIHKYMHNLVLIFIF